MLDSPWKRWFDIAHRRARFNEVTSMPTCPSRELTTFPNPAPRRDYEIAFECPELTCVCPMTGQPDFATIRIRYVPDERCVELKSLKLYLWSFRDEGHFHEAVTNRILDDLVGLLAPRRITVTGDFAVRGGIHTVVTATHEKGTPPKKITVVVPGGSIHRRGRDRHGATRA
jgi:7-cyano-7-deazaguanine reductase